MSNLREASVERDTAQLPGGALGQAGPFLLLFLLCLQPGIRYGAPRGAMRPFSLGLALAAAYFCAFACCGVLAAAATGGKLLVPLLVLLALPLLFAFFALTAR